MTTKHTGSSFFAPKADGTVSVSLADQTDFELTDLDREYARWAATNAFAAAQSGLSASDAKRVAKVHGKGVEERYRNAVSTVLTSVAGITGLPKKRLLPSFKEAASEGTEVKIDGGYGLKFGPNGAYLKNYEN